MPKKRKGKLQRRPGSRIATIELLEPTNRDRDLAGAYGGDAKVEVRKPNVKYAQERLVNSKKFRIQTANEPRTRA
jgi:hypothetical protein